MLSGKVIVYISLHDNFDEIKAFCDQNDIEIYRFDSRYCKIVAKPMQVYKLRKIFKKHYGKSIFNIELVD